MFSKADLEYLKQHDNFTITQANHHDVTIHSLTTGHDWVIVSNYETPDCYYPAPALRPVPISPTAGTIQELGRSPGIHYKT